MASSALNCDGGAGLGQSEKPNISVVIPVYNSAQTLTDLVLRLAIAMQWADRWELILVDDGSSDDSWSKIQAITRDCPTVKGIRLMRNCGQHNALLAGIRATVGSVIVTMDDDLQNPPEEVERLVAALSSADLVYGTPRDAHYGIARSVMTRLAKAALARVLGLSKAHEISAFRAFRRELCAAFDHYDGPFVSIDMLLAWATTNVSSVIVRHDARADGRSGYSFAKLVRHTVNVVSVYSMRPLQFASLLGFTVTGIGLIILAYVLVRYVAGGAVHGFTFLASVILIFSGCQLLVLGIIGEYLARVHFRVMGRPAYVIGGTTEEESRSADESDSCAL